MSVIVNLGKLLIVFAEVAGAMENLRITAPDFSEKAWMRALWDQNSTVCH